MNDTSARYDTPEPFTIDVPDRVLADLDERLRRWRQPVFVADGGWDYGTEERFLKDLVEYWQRAYDWRRCEEKLNDFPNYLVDIGQQRLHFIREPGTPVEDAPAPLPLVLTHGWPGSVIEFLDIIDKLAHPERHGGDALDSFDVIVPSLPGYGWSGPPMREGGAGPIGPRAIGRLWHRLITESLNYTRPYVAQGGDWGAAVSTWLAHDHPVVEKDGAKIGCQALHLNMMVFRPGIDEKTAALSPEEIAWLKVVRAERDAKTAYQRIQNTKPQSLGVGLTDSPVGLAAWIVEKFQGWSDCGGDPRRRFSWDTLIDTIMVYWLNANMASATWLYRGVREEDARLGVGETVRTPTAFMAFPADLAPPPPRAWVERAYSDLRRYSAMPSGGHFAALEEPDLLVEDIRAFCRPLRFGAAND